MNEQNQKTTPVALTQGATDGQLRLVIRDCALRALERVYDPRADLRTLATQMRDTAAVVVAELDAGRDEAAANAAIAAAVTGLRPEKGVA